MLARSVLPSAVTVLMVARGMMPVAIVQGKKGKRQESQEESKRQACEQPYLARSGAMGSGSRRLAEPNKTTLLRE